MDAKRDEHRFYSVFKCHTKSELKNVLCSTGCPDVDGLALHAFVSPTAIPEFAFEGTILVLSILHSPKNTIHIIIWPVWKTPVFLGLLHKSMKKDSYLI